MNAHPRQMWTDWQAQQRAARISTAALLAEVGLSAADFPVGVLAAPEFPVSAPPHFRGLIRRGDPGDPLLRQVLARGEEALPQPDRLTDPLEEADYRAAPGLLRKYRSRALLIASGACAIHCRYCFRRHYDYGDTMLTRSREAEALAAIAADPAIDEVILSGGDPLNLSDARLAGLVADIAGIGRSTAAQQGTAAQQFGTSAGNVMGQEANALAAGRIGRGSAYSGAIQGGLNAFQNYFNRQQEEKLFRDIFGRTAVGG